MSMSRSRDKSERLSHTAKKLQPVAPTEASNPQPVDWARDWSRRLFDDLKTDLAVFVVGGRIRDINDNGAAVLVGDEPAESLRGRFFADFIDRDQLITALPFLSGKAEAGEELHIRLVPDGRPSVEVALSSVLLDADKECVALRARTVRSEIEKQSDSFLSGDLYRCLFETSQAMICVLDGSGYILLVNESGWRTLGYDSALGMVGRPFLHTVHPDYHGVMEAGLDIFAAEDEALPMKFLRADAEIRDMEVMFSPLGDGQFMVEAVDITDLTKAAEVLQDREQRLRGILETVADAIITINIKGEVLSFNKAAEYIFGYKSSEVLGKNVSMLVGGVHADKHDEYLARYERTGESHIIDMGEREECARHKDGTKFPIELSVTELHQGSSRLFTGVIRDITERKRAEEQLKRAHDELEMRVEERTSELTQEIQERQRAEKKLLVAGEVIESLAEGVAIIDPDFRVSSVNPAFTAISGYKPDDVVGSYPLNHTALSRDGVMFDDMWRALEEKGRWEGEYWNRHKDGKEYAERLSITAITDFTGEVEHFAAIISDITKRKQDEERILYQANYDSLTGLPNRSLFLDRLNQSITAMERANRNLGLLFIDLDGFKLVNDTLGHDIGDLLLKETARRLGTCVRTGDTVARLGGDEFTIIMPSLDEPHNAPVVAQRVLDALSDAFVLGGHEAFVSASIGITIFPDDAKDAQELLKNADSAMYRAKENGKANYQFFTADMNEEVKERMVVKNGLSKALEHEEFTLFYQPKMNLETGLVTGVEALIRWQSPDLGLVSPVRFIPILEETGLVVEVGEWAIRKACWQHLEWVSEGVPPVPVAVNLSARQLREPTFVSIVKRALKDSGLSPTMLEIEITESMLMSDAPNIVIALQELHDLGIRVSMDDFGTGYSSLSYLKRFPIDTIKIDQSFVADIGVSTDDAIIIRTIINMGQTLNRKIIAEGVETQEQLDILKSYHCDEIQGYLFSRPLEADGFTQFMLVHSSSQ